MNLVPRAMLPGPRNLVLARNGLGASVSPGVSGNRTAPQLEDPGGHVAVGDIVPLSPQTQLLSRLPIPDSRVITIDPTLPVEEAAEDYAKKLRQVGPSEQPCDRQQPEVALGPLRRGNTPRTQPHVGEL